MQTKMRKRRLSHLNNNLVQVQWTELPFLLISVYSRKHLRPSDAKYSVYPSKDRLCCPFLQLALIALLLSKTHLFSPLVMVCCLAIVGDGVCCGVWSDGKLERSVWNTKEQEGGGRKESVVLVPSRPFPS